jgi:hypothetical protein
VIKRIERHVGRASGGWANAAALATFNRLLRDLAARLDQPREEQRLAALCFWGKTLYSTQRHGRWESAPVRRIILDELARFRVRVQ